MTKTPDSVILPLRNWHAARLAIALLFLFASGCGRQNAAPTPIRVAAASDLQMVLPRLIEQFTRQTGRQVTPSFGASGHLAEQIKGGAPFDVFLAANQSFVRDLAEAGLIKAGSVRPYARGSLVLAVFEQVSGEITRLEDLARPAVKKIALANPDTAPYGKAGKQALERAGLWKQLEPKIVMAESVRQALNYVQEGNAEAALVGRAIVKVKGVVSIDVDAGLYDPIIQALGILTSSTRPQEAESFAQFVLGEEGQRIMGEFGFAPPEGSATPASGQAEKPPPES
jgi:molybdate transport system substrate-binding protein